MGLLQAVLQAQQGNEGRLADALTAKAGISAMPSSLTQFAPDQQIGSAVDYETGQAYSPQSVPNPNKSQALQEFYQKYALSQGKPNIDISQFRDANPAMAIQALNTLKASDPRMAILKMVEDERAKQEGRQFDLDKLEKEYGLKEKLEKVKADNKEDKKSNYMVMFQEAYGRPPLNSKEFLGFIKSTKESPNIHMPKDDRFDKETKWAIESLAERGITKPTKAQIAKERLDLFQRASPLEQKIETFLDAMDPNRKKEKGSPAPAPKGKSKELTYNPQTGKLE